MDNIFGGTSITIWNGNFMACTCTIQTTKMTNGKKKNRVIYKPTKKEGTRLQGIVKNQMEIVEAENASLCTCIYSLYCAMTLEWPSLKQQRKLDSTTIQTIVPI